MEVKPGYKQTDVGVIPEEWEVKELSQLGTFKNGINKGKEDFGHGHPFVNLMDVFGIQTISSTRRELGLVNSSQSERKVYDLIRGDVLFVRSSVKPEGVGLTTLIDDDLKDTVFSGFLIRFRDSGLLEHSFKEHCFGEERFRARLISSSTVSANTNINQHALKRLKIVLPRSNAEQRAIAEALSDLDWLLSALDRLIAKNRDIKHAVMQQLLTGQTRLPGFGGEWLVKTLEQLADCLDSVRVPLNETQRATMKGDYPYCGANGVLDYVNGYVIDEDIILVAEDGGYFDEYQTRPIAYRMNGKCWVNNHAHILKAKWSFDQGFLFYSLVHRNILPYLASGTRAKLNKSEMNKIEVRFPHEKAEQTAIAKVFTDMDAELVALEQRRSKTRELKQAMMQELLTGRTRLV